MAAYAATVSAATRRGVKLGQGIGVLFGTVNVTNYNSTLAEITDITKHFRSDAPVVVADAISSNGYAVELNPTSKSLKCYNPTRAATFTGTAEPPELVVEESVTVASNTGTLAYAPAYIVAIEVTAGTVTGAFNVIPTGETAATKEVAVTFTSGVMTFKATDAVTACRVTYFPQQESGPFATSNLVIDETAVASASKVTLANRAMAVQYVYDDTDGALNVLEPVGEQPTATHNAVIDIVNGSSATDIDSHADDAGNTLKVTYLKYSGFNAAQQINDADTTLSSEAYNFTANNHHAIVVPAYGTQLVGEQTATNIQVSNVGPSGTAGAGVAVWNPYLNSITTNEGTAIDTLAMPYFYYEPSLAKRDTPAGTITAGVATEVANDTNVGSVNFFAVGTMR